ncbi:MAG: phenylacetate--CoA ligase family protein [Deltaproteobacteria bacterium]|nr:phenylacetate--CoA ligase family protein [Deltaproteobacteria bacterium]
MPFDQSVNGPFPGLAAIPLTLANPDGNPATALLDIPEMADGPLIPVLVPPVFGRPKEELGPVSEALTAQNRFIVFRPAFRSTGDEAPGNLDDMYLSGEECTYWGRYLRSEQFHTLCRNRQPDIQIDTRVACVAMSIGATQAFLSQAEHQTFDALALLSFVPHYPTFVRNKVKRDYYDLVSIAWALRMKSRPGWAACCGAIAARKAEEGEDRETARRYQLLADRLSNTSRIDRSQMASMLEGVPVNAFSGIWNAIRGTFDCRYDLEANLQSNAKVGIPLTFISGGKDDYFLQEEMDEFIALARREGRVRRLLRLENACHQLRPYPCFEKAMEFVIQGLYSDLGIQDVPVPFSLARIAVRRFYEVRGFALRHSKDLGAPPELTQKVLLSSEDLARVLGELFKRPAETGALVRLLARSAEQIGGERSILDELEPVRIGKILNKSLSPELYPSIAIGLSEVPELIGHLFPDHLLQALDPEHLDGLLQELLRHTEALEAFLTTANPELLLSLGRRKALAAAQRAIKLVPAFTGHNLPKDLDQVPFTSKEDYVEAFPLEDRCIHRELPREGLIDESSGSSGIPTNWTRCREEEDRLANGARFIYRFLFGRPGDDRPVILLNGFSQGAWATSTKLTVLARHVALVKNIGPEEERILDSLEYFGRRYRYIIAGYPPFLRELVRAATERVGFDLKPYTIDILHGGEGYTAGWRRYLEVNLGSGARIVSSYGASDLDLGVAYETTLALVARKILEENPEFRRALLETERIPVFFGQYNPIEFFLETRRHDGECRTLVCTVTNLKAHQPRIRYDIGDEGDILPFDRIVNTAREFGFDLPASGSLKFPFVYIFGRLDGTISIDGANVYPDQVHEAILTDHQLAPLVRGFRLRRSENSSGEVRFEIDLEMFGDETTGGPDVSTVAGKRICDYLAKVNIDFRESLAHNPAATSPEVRVVRPGELGIGTTIKRRYVDR